MNILVTDGENRSALAVTRSLGKKGCSVLVAGKTARTLASSSKFCCGGYKVPDPLVEGEGYVSALNEIATKEKVDVIFPMTEQSIYQLNSVREKLPLLACPELEKMSVISDKSALFRLAESLGVAMPKTLYLDTNEDLCEVIDKVESYPVVVKPARSKVPSGKGFLSAGVQYANSKNELQNLYLTNPILQYPSMIQEKIIGHGTGLFSLYDKNRHLVLFSHRRLREKPPSGGVSVVSESVPLDGEMVKHADRLLSAVNWQGVAMVEFKRDQRDGSAKLMEINGRFWGSLQLAIACGIDFPSLLLDYLQERSFETSIKDYCVGHKLKWILGTLDHLVIRLKYENKEINLSSCTPSKWQAFLDFARMFEKKTSYDVFDWYDIGPFLFESRSYVRQNLLR